MSYASTDEPERSDGVAPPAPTLVVGIGASSGGLEALRSFCSALPRETGLAFVIIQHLDDSAPNHIYIAPAHSIVRLHGGVFEVVKATTPEERRGLIDVFFHSLADDRQAGAIGVILSGSGTDGALGLKAISDGGGMTIVQEPETARYDSMPRSGATLGVADRVLPPEKMASEIVAYAKHVQSLLVGDDGGAVREQIGGALGSICEILERHTEHNFKHYKTSTLVRRISRRMNVLRIASAADYVARLEDDAAEVQALFRE